MEAAPLHVCDVRGEGTRTEEMARTPAIDLGCALFQRPNDEQLPQLQRRMRYALDKK